MLITVQPNPSWQLSLAQLSPSLFFTFFSPPFCADPLRKGHVPLQIVGDDIDLRGLIKLASMNLSVRHTFDWLYNCIR